ncbi:MAG: CoA-binding protein [Fibrobacterota bacterium]
MEHVAVLGASPKTERYSYKAVKLLQEKGHTVFPVNPAGKEIDGLSSYKSLGEIDRPVDTLTLYVNPKRSVPLADEMKALRPTRVIMNPGTESDELQEALEEADIRVIRACTLVMLRTNQF